jgi:hypothetical protein
MIAEVDMRKIYDYGLKTSVQDLYSCVYRIVKINDIFLIRLLHQPNAQYNIILVKQYNSNKEIAK